MVGDLRAETHSLCLRGPDKRVNGLVGGVGVRGGVLLWGKVVHVTFLSLPNILCKTFDA